MNVQSNIFYTSMKKLKSFCESMIVQQLTLAKSIHDILTNARERKNRSLIYSRKTNPTIEYHTLCALRPIGSLPPFDKHVAEDSTVIKIDAHHIL